MEKETCKFCNKVIEGYTEKQTSYMLKQHILSKHQNIIPWDSILNSIAETGVQGLEHDVSKKSEIKPRCINLSGKSTKQ